MKNSTVWVIAVLITLLTAYYQRKTGPTYPISSEVKINNSEVKYTLDRSHGGMDDFLISITVPEEVAGKVYWKRYKTNDEYTQVEMINNKGKLTARLPHQPPAGKLQYKVVLFTNDEKIVLNNGVPVIIRFKGDVPLWILLPHIFTIFMAMLYSNRTGLEYFRKEKNLGKYLKWTMIFLITGGFIFGPLTQYYAFGALWTGFPFGYDLTDNKTLFAFIGWLVALFMYFKSKKPEFWALVAAIVLFIVYLIPHSVLGSELDYNKLDKHKKTEQLNK